MKYRTTTRYKIVASLTHDSAIDQVITLPANKTSEGNGLKSREATVLYLNTLVQELNLKQPVTSVIPIGFHGTNEFKTAELIIRSLNGQISADKMPSLNISSDSEDSRYYARHGGFLLSIGTATVRPSDWKKEDPLQSISTNWQKLSPFELRELGARVLNVELVTSSVGHPLDDNGKNHWSGQIYD